MTGQQKQEESFIIVSSRIYDALDLFTPQRKGQLFILLRHPVQRIVSKYFFMTKAKWENSYREPVASMSFREYTSSKYCDSNWVTRRLVNKMQGELNEDDLILAKEILRRKALILLMDDLVESMERLRIYFDWHREVLNDEQVFCVNKFTQTDPMNVNHEKIHVEPNSLEWNTIRDKNLMDIELMKFAKQLYAEQGEVIQRNL